MNLVYVNYYGTKYALHKLPDSANVKKGDRALILLGGKETAVSCVTDSFYLEDNVAQTVAVGNNQEGSFDSIVGVYRLERFDEKKEPEDKDVAFVTGLYKKRGLTLNGTEEAYNRGYEDAKAIILKKIKEVVGYGSIESSST